MSLRPSVACIFVVQLNHHLSGPHDLAAFSEMSRYLNVREQSVTLKPLATLAVMCDVMSRLQLGPKLLACYLVSHTTYELVCAFVQCTARTLRHASGHCTFVGQLPRTRILNCLATRQPVAHLYKEVTWLLRIFRNCFIVHANLRWLLVALSTAAAAGMQQS